MGGLYRWLAAAAVTVVCAAWLIVPVARAAEAPSAMVVVDHSRSMWGPMEGTKQGKYLLVREALRSGLRKVSPQTRIGLVAFGHRRLDCSDAEVMRSPEPLDVERIMAPLELLTPRGTGPLSLALREAARALTGDGPRSLILIHDDADNCQADLCNMAAELRAVGIKAHVVGLGVKAADVAKMACLPQMTGGRYFNAATPDQAVGFVEDALRLANAGASGADPAPAQPPSVGTAAAPPRLTGPTALHLRALLAPNAEPLGIAVRWTVAAEARPGVSLFDARAASPVVPVSPGRYLVEVHEGPLVVRQTVEVRDAKPIAVPLVLNAAAVRIRALAPKTATPFPDALVMLSETGGALVFASKTGDVTALLPAGRFVARAELGLVRAEQSISVTAGQQVTFDLALNAARLQLTAPPREGATAFETAIFSVLEDDPDAPQGRRELARTAAQQAEFVLSPGTYYIVARQGAVEVRERLAIGPGDIVRRVLNPAAGRLSLSTKVAIADASASDQVSYTVTRIDGGVQEPLITSLPTPTLLLPSGRYRVEGRYGLMNAVSTREVEIKAGQVQQLQLEPQVALLRLRLPGAAVNEIWWDIRDETGKAVWTDGQTEAVANLLAGRYIVRAETRDKRYERPVELRAGESKTLEITD
jgi:Ca-activated chloride channel homolog